MENVTSVRFVVLHLFAFLLLVLLLLLLLLLLLNGLVIQIQSVIQIFTEL